MATRFTKNRLLVFLLFCALVGVVAWAILFRKVQPQEVDSSWYHMSQGTEFVPLRFLLALSDSKTGKPFMENLERFGFIPDSQDPIKNRFGLPVGMTAAPTLDLNFTGVEMVGINCAACHTAVLEFKGKQVLRADGGTNMFDADSFHDSLKQSLKNTCGKRTELVSFVSRLLRQPKDELFAVDVSKKGPAINLVANPLADRIEEIFAAQDGPDKLVADKIHELIDQEPKADRLDLTGNLVTGRDGLKKQDIVATLRAKVTSVLPKEAFPEPLPLVEVITALRLLQARLEALLAAEPDVETTPPGFGRVDAFGGARNTLFPKNAGSKDAPVRYPFIWTIKDRLKWYHWDGNTQSILERNTAEALGVGAVLNPNTFDSTIRFDNLARLEKLALGFKPPVWPKEFGPIDQKKANEGAKHFAKYCANCHDGLEADGHKIVPLNDIKTDARRVQNVRRPVGDSDFFKAQSKILRGTILKAGLQLDSDKIVWRPSKDLEPNLPAGYPNRPLPAVWASPPYLHNGSVVNLYQLLLPAEKRDKTFPVGHREYDPQHLGYTLKPARILFLYDTSQPGNSNSGHSGIAYGTELTDNERWELIEFLKTH
jgi:hypothetical protein